MPASAHCGCKATAGRGIAFVDSLENPGGRDRWVERMVAHHRNLASVKPSIDCWQTTPGPTPSTTLRSGHTQESYRELLRLQRKIEDIHDGRDKPRRALAQHQTRSKQLAEQMSNNRRARRSASATADAAHRANLAHMHRRIANYSSETERRKNPFDTTHNPARLLRRREELPAGALLDLELSAAAARAARRPASAGRQRWRQMSEAAIARRAEEIVEQRMRHESSSSWVVTSSGKRITTSSTSRTVRSGAASGTARAGARPASARRWRGEGTADGGTWTRTATSSGSARARPSSARHTRSESSGRRRALSAEYVGPGLEAESEYDAFSRALTSAIIGGRLFHEDELRAELLRALHDPAYAHLDFDELRARTKEVAAEFYCQIDV